MQSTLLLRSSIKDHRLIVNSDRQDFDLASGRLCLGYLLELSKNDRQSWFKLV